MRYIVTSSLNVDNILSTECVSPYSFYVQRTFGYAEFVQLAELETVDCLLLFSEIPSFSISDSERQNYPMVLQIDDKDIEEKAVEVADYQGCKVYAYGDTIHLTPVNCRLQFFTDEARVLAHLRCGDSKLCKMAEYFHYETVGSSQVSLQGIVGSLDKSKLPSIVKSSENEYNRIKGFIYGYALGYLKSLTPNVAHMLSKQIQINEIVAVICNHGRSSDHYDSELQRLDKEYAELDPEVERAKKEWDEYAITRGNKEHPLDETLKELGVEAQAKTNFCKRHNIVLRTRLDRHHMLSDLKPFNDELKKRMDSLIQIEGDARRSEMDIRTQLDIDPTYATAMLSGEDEQSMKFNKVLGNILWEGLIPDLGTLRTQRHGIVEKISEKLKGLAIEENVLDYFQHLCASINDFKSFKLSEVGDIIWQSLAAFLHKGDDYQGLVSNLEKKAIPSRQYAMALWGAVNGYVKIPRPILSALSEEDIEKLYRDTYSLMNAGKEMQGILSKYVNQPFTPASIPAPRTHEASWREKILQLVKDLPRKLFPTDKKSEAEEDAQKCLDECDTEEEFIGKLKSYPSWQKQRPKGQPSKAWEELRNNFAPNNIVSHGKTEPAKDLFSEQKEIEVANEESNKENKELAAQTLLLEDKTWWNSTANMIKDEKARKRYLVDVEWFVGNHQPQYKDKKKGLVKGFFNGNDTSNVRVIERFKKYLENKLLDKGVHMKWLRDLYANIPIEEIIRYLNNNYAHR